MANREQEKQATMKHLKTLLRDFHVSYQNAIGTTSFKIIASRILNSHITQNYERNGYEAIFKLISKNIELPIILMVDECLNLVKSDPDGLYHMIRSAELYGLHMGMIFASVDNVALHMPSAEIRRLGLFHEMRFPRYSMKELYTILHDRVERSLYPGVISDQVMADIAQTSAGSGSARMAIEILQKSAFMAEYKGSESISVEYTRAAASLINPYITESKLMELDRKELVILLSLCEALENNSNIAIESLEEQAKINFENYSIGSIDQAFLYRAIRHLETLDIISSHKQGQGKGAGVRKILSMNDTPVGTLREKIYEILG
jgi:Cdc6-related protein, AAA superfamily ATPase